jgi:hypothetical protein
VAGVLDLVGLRLPAGNVIAAAEDRRETERIVPVGWAESPRITVPMPAISYGKLPAWFSCCI